MKTTTPLGWPHRLLELLFPERCIFCGRVTAGDTQCCPHCDRLLRRQEQERMLLLDDSPVYSVFYYRDRARQRIADLKFHGKPELAEYFAKEMATLLLSELGSIPFDQVVYLPMPEVREAGRGYNQAELLARHLGERLGLPCGLCGLSRSATFAQHDLHLGMRQKQPNSGFAIAPEERVPGRLVLVDDVCTSGSSLRSCMRLLRSGGAKEITAITVCR